LQDHRVDDSGAAPGQPQPGWSATAGAGAASTKSVAGWGAGPLAVQRHESKAMAIGWLALMARFALTFAHVPVTICLRRYSFRRWEAIDAKSAWPSAGLPSP
jgi:hypothetical protein